LPLKPLFNIHNNPKNQANQTLFEQRVELRII